MKKILVARSSMPPMEEYINEIRELWDSHWLTNMGVKHEQLEKELIHYLQVPNISLMSNGHMALEMTLQAMKLSGEVITTPFTFASTTHSIVRSGLTPVFCDINEQDYTMDVEMLESLITDRTSAILPVHVYGNVCNVDKIDKIARKYNLKVIYDAAHAFGEEYQGQGIGNFGDASIFSFHATKVFNTIEGGAVCYKDEGLGLDLYRLKNFGIRGQETVDWVGANAKMNEFQAAMGICNLRHINDEIEKRKKVANYYLKRLANVPGIKACGVQKGLVQNYAYFPVRVNKDEFRVSRDELFDVLGQNDIFARKYFYPITNTYDCYKGIYNVEQTPIAKKVSEEILTLPFYADLQEEQVERICNIIVAQHKW